jgi:hypothetical protein
MIFRDWDPTPWVLTLLNGGVVFSMVFPVAAAAWITWYFVTYREYNAREHLLDMLPTAILVMVLLLCLSAIGAAN